MRPDDRQSAFDDLADPGMDLPFDADLESLHAELAAAGQHARRVLYGRTQPTRLFSNQLRAHLLGEMAAPPGPMTTATGAAAGTAALELGPQRAHQGRPMGTAGAAAADPSEIVGHDMSRQRPSLALPEPRTLLALLAIAGMAAVLALGAVSGTFGPPLP
jgi:hypothetical protein